MCGLSGMGYTVFRPGTPPREWKQARLSDGYVLVSLPEWDVTKEMMFAAASGIHLFAS